VASGALDPAVPWITVVTYAPPSRVAFERREGLIHVVVTGGGRRETLVLDAARLERTLVAVARETSQVRS
jgi:hypothetical protein